MEGLRKYKDLEEHFYDSLTIIDERNEILKGKQDLEAIMNKLNEENVILREFEQKLTQQLKTFSSNAEDQDAINTLYMKLKEKHSELQNKSNQLEKEKVEVEEKYKWEKNEITEDFVKQMQVFEKRNEDQKKAFLKTQSELNNELMAQQAAADIRYDEMESHLQSQIRDISGKLHESIQSCNTIRQELFALKTRDSSDMDSAKKRIQELERELRLSKQQLQLTNDNFRREINQPRPTLFDSNRPAPNIVKNRIVVYNENLQCSTAKPNYVCSTTKYHSLNAGTGIEREASSEEFPEVLRENVNVPPEPLRNVQCATGFSRYTNKQSNIKFPVPPLKQISAAPPKQRMNIKKRKLYNPDNLDYLLDMEPQE